MLARSVSKVVPAAGTSLFKQTPLCVQTIRCFEMMKKRRTNSRSGGYGKNREIPANPQYLKVESVAKMEHDKIKQRRQMAKWHIKNPPSPATDAKTRVRMKVQGSAPEIWEQVKNWEKSEASIPLFVTESVELIPEDEMYDAKRVVKLSTGETIKQGLCVSDDIARDLCFDIYDEEHPFPFKDYVGIIKVRMWATEKEVCEVDWWSNYSVEGNTQEEVDAAMAKANDVVVGWAEAMKFEQDEKPEIFSKENRVLYDTLKCYHPKWPLLSMTHEQAASVPLKA